MEPRELDALVSELSRWRAPDALDANAPRAARRARGIFFTPQPLATFTARLAVATYFDDASADEVMARSAPVIADLAAGDGRLLLAARDALVAQLIDRGATPRRASRWAAACEVVAVERDPAMAAVLRETLGQHSRVLEGDALLALADSLPPLDLVLGNPPYVRSVRLREADPDYWAALRGRFAATNFREWDLYGAFIETAQERLAEGGAAALIVPSRWMTAAFGAPLRAHLAGLGAVRQIVDFGARQLFPGATTYTSIVVLSNKPSPVVKLARSVGSVGSAWQIGAIDAAGLGRSPWRLTVGRARGVLDRLLERGPALATEVEVRKGTGTNADRVFVLTEVEAETAAAAAARGLLSARAAALPASRPQEFEIAALRRCFRGRDIGPFLAKRSPPWLITPYSAKGALLRRAEFAARFPKTDSYLCANAETLQRREGGAYRDADFHRFGRPQNLAWLGDLAPKVIIPDVFREARALIDDSGALVLDSAYALRPRHPNSPYDAEVLCGLFNSAVIAFWLGQTGVWLRGNYLRMKTRYLADLPLPPEGALEPIRLAVRRRDAAALAVAVGAAYGVTARELER